MQTGRDLILSLDPAQGDRIASDWQAYPRGMSRSGSVVLLLSGWARVDRAALRPAQVVPASSPDPIDDRQKACRVGKPIRIVAAGHAVRRNSARLWMACSALMSSHSAGTPAMTPPAREPALVLGRNASASAFVVTTKQAVSRRATRPR